MERNDIAALRALFPERHWGWVDSYLTDESGWPLVEHFTGPDRAVVAARSLSPTTARVVIEGERGQGFVSVTFGEDGKVAGFALYGEEFEGIGTIVLSSPRDRRRDMTRFYKTLLGDDPRRLPQFAFWGGAHDPPPRWPDPDAPPQMHLDARVGDLEKAGQVVGANGATLLHDFGDHRTYVDPAGHPSASFRTPAAPIGTIRRPSSGESSSTASAPGRWRRSTSGSSASRCESRTLPSGS